MPEGATNKNISPEAQDAFDLYRFVTLPSSVREFCKIVEIYNDSIRYLFIKEFLFYKLTMAHFYYDEENENKVLRVLDQLFLKWAHESSLVKEFFPCGPLMSVELNDRFDLYTEGLSDASTEYNYGDRESLSGALYSAFLFVVTRMHPSIDIDDDKSDYPWFEIFCKFEHILCHEFIFLHQWMDTLRYSTHQSPKHIEKP